MLNFLLSKKKKAQNFLEVRLCPLSNGRLVMSHNVTTLFLKGSSDDSLEIQDFELPKSGGRTED